MEDLRLALTVIGVFVFIAILVHGLWTIRKNTTTEKTEPKVSKAEGRNEDFADISLDDPLLNTDAWSDLDDGSQRQPATNPVTEDPANKATEGDPLLGDKPIIAAEDLVQPDVPETPNQPPRTDKESNHSYDQDGIGTVRVVAVKEEIRQPQNKASQTDEPKPQTAEAPAIPEPPSSLLKVDEPVTPTIDINIDVDTPRKKTAAAKPAAKSASLGERARKLVRGAKPEHSAKESAKSKAGKNQISLELEAEPQIDADSTQTAAGDVPEMEQEVLILSVRVPEGSVISGANLLPTLLTLGFKFGEHNMFHRHANSNGKGPKLFTLANMFNPGTFDIDSMENFSTSGLSLFMTLPIEADPHQVFNMMHNAARKLADEFGGQVLDSRRSVLSRPSLQQYIEKIREFERRRMIRRQ